MPINANSAVFGTLKNIIKHFSGHECIFSQRTPFCFGLYIVFNVKIIANNEKGTIYDNLPEIGQHFVHERNVPGAPSHGHCLPFLFKKNKLASNRKIFDLKNSDWTLRSNCKAGIGVFDFCLKKPINSYQIGNSWI
jgi:hypothetical protein